MIQPPRLPAIAGCGLLGLALCTASAAWAQPAQRVHREGFALVDSATFALMCEFHALDPSLPLGGRVVEAWATDHARFEKVVYTTQSGERVPGQLALPPQGAGPFPCVLLLHGLGNDKERWWREDREALPRTLLAAGIAVLAIDLRHHGERSATNDHQSPVYLTFGDSLFIRSRDMVIQSTIDARRALAWLRQRGDIDAARLGVMGYSMGAMTALHLAALEPALAAVVVSAVPTGEQPLPIDHFQFAARARAPVLLQFGRKDWLSSPADAERLLALLPERGRRLSFYDAGHQLPASFATDAAEWLRATLR